MRRRMPKNLQFDLGYCLVDLKEKLCSSGVNTEAIESIFRSLKFYLNNNKKYKSTTVTVIKHKLAECGFGDSEINSTLNDIYCLYPSLA